MPQLTGKAPGAAVHPAAQDEPAPDGRPDGYEGEMGIATSGAEEELTGGGAVGVVVREGWNSKDPGKVLLHRVALERRQVGARSNEDPAGEVCEPGRPDTDRSEAAGVRVGRDQGGEPPGCAGYDLLEILAAIQLHCGARADFPGTVHKPDLGRGAPEIDSCKNAHVSSFQPARISRTARIFKPREAERDGSRGAMLSWRKYPYSNPARGTAGGRWCEVKITVGSGDRGRTSLLSGERVLKTDQRVEACGDVDELCSILGALAASVQGEPGLMDEIARIQGWLLRAGARLAATPGSAAAGMLANLGEEEVGTLERSMAVMEENLTPLQGFVIPGGHPSAAWAHVARTVCRRAERRVLSLAAGPGGEVDPYYLGAISLLNRLSDYLFVAARHCNAISGTTDALWRT
jgi:cob(I)alamin adenosyltransferase